MLHQLWTSLYVSVSVLSVSLTLLVNGVQQFNCQLTCKAPVYISIHLPIRTSASHTSQVFTRISLYQYLYINVSLCFSLLSVHVQWYICLSVPSPVPSPGSLSKCTQFSVYNCKQEFVFYQFVHQQYVYSNINV